MRLTWLDEINGLGDVKEKISFAWMTMEEMAGRPMLVSKRFETDEPCVVGKITLGANVRETMATTLDFRKGYLRMLPLGEP